MNIRNVGEPPRIEYDPRGPLTDPSIGGDFATYILSVRSDDESAIWSVDVDMLSNFYQKWYWDPDAEAYLPSASGSSRSGGEIRR